MIQPLETKYIYFSTDWLISTYKNNPELALMSVKMPAKKFVMEEVDNPFYGYLFRNDGEGLPLEYQAAHLKVFRRDVQYPNTIGIPIILNADIPSYKDKPGIMSVLPVLTLGWGEAYRRMAQYYTVTAITFSNWLNTAADEEFRNADSIFLHTDMYGKPVAEILEDGILPDVLWYDPETEKDVLSKPTDWKEIEKRRQMESALENIETVPGEIK